MTSFQDFYDSFDLYNIHVLTSSIERSIVLRLATADKCQVHTLLCLPDCESCQEKENHVYVPIIFMNTTTTKTDNEAR